MDTLKDANVSRGVAMYPQRADGYWPIINLQPIEDYPDQSSPMHPDLKREGSAAREYPDRYLRIHMDVPLGSKEIFDQVREALNQKDREKAHRIMTGWPKFPDGTKRARDFLKVALRNDD